MSKQERQVKRMRLAARIIALGAAGFLLISMIGSAIAEAPAEGSETAAIEGILLVVIGGVALAGGILSWWRERLAGILLVLAAMAMGIHIGVVAGRNQFIVWLVMGLPFLVAGLLFLSSWRLSKKTV